MKKIFILFAAALTIGLTGCQSFLEEETYGSTTEIFKEENGIKALVYQSYTKINNLYGGDGQWPLMTELGTDIYLRGKNQGDVGLCDYYGLDATNGNVAWLWNHCYKALFNINLFFETIDQTPFADEDEKSQFKAEMYVMRALFLWIVTETWGDSYLPMTTDETEGTEARRSPRAKFYEEIIGALEAAIGLFPDTRTTESGRIDMPAAKALLARMYLYNEQWDEAADMASQVIGHYGLELCPSLKDLWADDKTNNEFIWTTEFTEDDAFRQANGYWSWYAMYIDRFPGVQTMLKWTGYGGCQAIPSTYFMDNYGVAKDEAHLVIDGIGTITNGQNGSASHQTNKIIVFDPKCYASANPFLYIDEYDVQASHAAGVGKMDEEHLYYLQSRGLTKRQAMQLITYGYLMPVVEVVDNQMIKERFELALSKVGA